MDVALLRENGFRVSEVSAYEAIFEMLSQNRIDLFPRGVNEIYKELEMQGQGHRIVDEKTMVLFYPLPRFFITHKDNNEIAERILEGLQQAHEDGSLLGLWLAQYGDSVEKAKLSGRRVFRLDNPFITTLDPSYEAYCIDPMQWPPEVE